MYKQYNDCKCIPVVGGITEKIYFFSKSNFFDSCLVDFQSAMSIDLIKFLDLKQRNCLDLFAV